MTYKESQSYLLDKRQLTPATIAEFNISFCSRQGYLYAPTTYPTEFTQLERQFFDCLIFPVQDLYGESIAVMSRRMYDSKNKYVNSANSNKFTKGRHLYGLNKSHPYILEANQAIVVEGLFDFLQLYQNGVRNVVAMMGTSISDHQVALLSRFTDNVVILPDSDAAGVHSGNKHVKSLQKYVKCQYVRLPTKQDPDELLLDIGAKAFLEHINTSLK